MDPFIALLVFVFGLAVGSFLNVAVFRMREGRSLITGASRCTACEEPIGWYDMIPVVSFLLLRGRCRHCKAVFSAQYPLIEFATGALFFLFYLRYATGFALPSQATTETILAFFLRDLIFTGFLLIIFVYDFKHSLILDRFTIPAMIVAILANLFVGIDPLSMLLGALVIGGFFFLQFTISKGKWIGGGDIRMGVLMGLMLGFKHGLVALFLSYVIGAAVALVLLATKKADMKTQIPFGTFLATGTLIVLFVGEPLLQWYLGLFVSIN